VRDNQGNSSRELAFSFYIHRIFSHAHAMRHRNVLDDNEWTGWLRLMKSAFEQGKINEYWKSNLEIEKWFDPAFEEFIIKELAPTVKVNK
jgi:hypothetical protein